MRLKYTPRAAGIQSGRWSRDWDCTRHGAVHTPGSMNMEKLKIRKSGIHGEGVVAGAALAARRKIGEVGGRWVRLPEARRRAERRARIYLIEVSRRLALDCSRGNALGKLNHSCEPNCYLRVFRRHVEVYALRGIRPGEELTVDYGETPHRGGMPCRCGQPACRGKI